jgi:hypothetical protein
MPSIAGLNCGHGLFVLLIGALASCGHEQGGDGGPTSTAEVPKEDTLAAPPSLDAVVVADPATVEPAPPPVKQPLSVRWIPKDERGAYEQEIQSRLSIEVTKDSEPELWEQVERLREALGHVGELMEVLRSESGVIEYRTLGGRFSNGNGYGASVRAKREGDGWIILRQGRWIN